MANPTKEEKPMGSGDYEGAEKHHAEKHQGSVVDDSQLQTIPDNIHPKSWALFQKFPFLEAIPVLGLVLKAYSPHLVLAVCVERFCVKGVSHGFMRLSIQPMLTGRYGVSGATYQRLSSLYGLGWSVNAFFTAIADTFAIFGYTKRWYSVFCAIGCGVFALLYALLPAAESSANPAAGFMFLTALFLANVDTFAQAIYSRRIRANPERGPALVSWGWGAAKFGAMIAAAVQGPLSDNNLTNVGVYIVSGILFALSLVFVFNVFGEQPNRISRVEDAKADYILRRREERAQEALEASSKEPAFVEDHEAALVPHVLSSEEEDDLVGFVEPEVDSVLWGAVEVNREVVTRNWRLIIYCCLMTAAVVATSVVTILGTRWDMMWACIAMTIVVCGAAFCTMPLVIAKSGTFIYFFNIFYLSLPGVLNTFYVAKPKCLPNGPHFNYTFYNIMNGIIGNVCSIAGITLFAHCCQNLSYRAIMGSSAIIIPLISVFDLIMVERWNTYIGIPDHAMYVFGDAIIFETVDMLVRMPTFLLMSRVAPRGSEAMVLALLGGIAHLGQSTSSAVGYLLLETIWPVKTKGKCDYHNAPWLVIAGHIGLPLLILPIAFLLLPSSRVSATLDENGDEVEEVKVPRDPAASSSTDTSILTTSVGTSHSSHASEASDDERRAARRHRDEM